jgi:hypothetical protein
MRGPEGGNDDETGGEWFIRGSSGSLNFVLPSSVLVRPHLCFVSSTQHSIPHVLRIQIHRIALAPDVRVIFDVLPNSMFCWRRASLWTITEEPSTAVLFFTSNRTRPHILVEFLTILTFKFGGLVECTWAACLKFRSPMLCTVTYCR